MTDRKAQQRRLEGAGFRFHSGWLPEANPVGARFDAQTEAFRAEVEALKAEAPRPRGWPKGKPRKAEK
jgi:hypothetical protein